MLPLLLDFETAITSSLAEVIAVCVALLFSGVHEWFLQRFAMKTAPESGVRRKSLVEGEELEVSLVVCIRNGAHHWPFLWEALKEQRGVHWELVLVDDVSSDDLQVHWAEARKEEVDFPIQWLEMKTSRLGKKDALQMGVRRAKGPVIAVTDVDCVPSCSEWLSELCREFGAGAEGVLGVSLPMDSGKTSWLGACQRFDALRIARSYVAWAQFGYPYMGVGRNMAYKKELFQGFKDHEDLPSGDDDLLVQSWLKREDVRVVPVIQRSSQTDTHMPATWKAWSRQKQRHWLTAWRYSLKHKIGLAFPKIATVFLWMSISAWIWSASKEGVLHIVLWIVGGLLVGRWGVRMLNFRSFAKACGTSASWHWLGWVQPFLDAWIGWQALISRRFRNSSSWD